MTQANGKQATQTTPASAWRKVNELITLPSGKVAELKKPNAISMIIEDGSVPDSLIGIVAGNINGRPQTTAAPEYNRGDISGILNLAETICRAAFVSPVIVEDGKQPDYDAGEISIEDVDENDRIFVMNWAFSGGAATNAARFRQQ